MRPAASRPAALRRQLGLAAVTAIVVGDMLGSGIFFTPGELAAVAYVPWHVYFIWGLCGFITLCGALTLAELCALVPQAGASYHIIREGYGTFWAFLTVWMQLWVGGPGSVAGIAIAFGEFVSRGLSPWLSIGPVGYGAAAILFFAGLNSLGVEWGGRTQVALTSAKVAGLMGLVGGSLWLASAIEPAAVAAAEDPGTLLRMTGLGVAAVLFTYDGWVDVSHVAGEVQRPERTLPWGLGLGVAALTLLYLVVNYAFLRVVPLEGMRGAATTAASRLAEAAFGPEGGRLLNVLVIVSIFGSLGGLVMTVPRLFYTLAASHADEASGLLRFFWTRLARVSPTSAVPVGAIWFTALGSIVALAFFGSFSRLVNFFVVPLQLSNILMVASIFRLRPRVMAAGILYRTPGYPLTPIVYMGVLLALLVSTIVYRPLDTLLGIALTATGVPVYLWLARKRT